jgi:hypothetical protein
MNHQRHAEKIWNDAIEAALNAEIKVEAANKAAVTVVFISLEKQRKVCAQKAASWITDPYQRRNAIEAILNAEVEE